MQYDVIIVGAGLGGLTAGAKLAKEGRKVLVLEQHDRPGGCATTFKRRNFTMEVGLHEMDGLHRADPKLKIFTELGIMDKVEFLELPDFYRFINERYDIVIPHNPDEAKVVLNKSFPDEKKGIEKYFYNVLNARKIMKESQGKNDKSLGEFLDEIISNEDLKLVLLGNLGYFHDDPYSLSYYYYLNAQGAYYSGRANFIKGGSQKLSNALVSIIEEYGGTVKLNRLVSKINFKNDMPSGVDYQKTKTLKSEEFHDEAPEIIINAALPMLANKLLPKHLAKELKKEIKNKNIGASLLTVYFGFNKNLKKVGNQNYSTFIYHDSVLSPKDILKNNHSDFNKRSFTFVDYSHVDSDLAPDGKSVGAVCCVDYTKDWEDLSPKQYKEKKAYVAEVIADRCNKLIPGFRNSIEYVEVATSLTVERYTLNPKGAVYGFAQNPDKTMEYLNVLPKNIHIASAWGKFGGGFSGAIISGYMTAFDILRKGRK